ncbi:ASCH domain-containing protein [Streptomyces sp. NPDC054796]
MSDQNPATVEHTLNLRKPYFDLIASGDKTVEVRVGYTKIRKMAVGGLLRFNSGADTLLTRITAVNEYESFTALLNAEDPTAIAGTAESWEKLMAAIRDIYPRRRKPWALSPSTCSCSALRPRTPTPAAARESVSMGENVGVPAGRRQNVRTRPSTRRRPSACSRTSCRR